MIGRIALVLALLAPSDRTPFTGVGVQGGGTVCNSGVRVYPTYIDWDTRDSDCLHTAYDTIEQHPQEFIYRLKPRTRKCISRVLIVRRQPEMDAWETIGYTSEAAWRRKDHRQELECGPMY